MGLSAIPANEKMEIYKDHLFRIRRRINHPNYKPPLLEYDIALYKLERAVTLGPFIRPSCLALPVSEYQGTNLPSDEVYVTGWEWPPATG